MVGGGGRSRLRMGVKEEKKTKWKFGFIEGASEKKFTGQPVTPNECANCESSASARIGRLIVVGPVASLRAVW